MKITLENCVDFMDLFIDQLESIRNEIEGLSVRPPPSYDEQGVESLHSALGEITAVISRTSSLHSNAVITMGSARRVMFRVNGWYQDAYDKVVADSPANRVRSWEDQASLFRVSVIDELRTKRVVEDRMIRAQSEFDAIEVLARSRYRLRNDYSPMLDTLRVGNILSEV